MKFGPTVLPRSLQTKLQKRERLAAAVAAIRQRRGYGKQADVRASGLWVGPRGGFQRADHGEGRRCVACVRLSETRQRECTTHEGQKAPFFAFTAQPALSASGVLGAPGSSDAQDSSRRTRVDEEHVVHAENVASTPRATLLVS